MNASDLQALRRLLFHSAAEAARHLAADAERPQGVEERTWNRWESGKMPVPANVAAFVLQAVQQRQALIDRWQSELAAECIQSILLVWYAEADDHRSTVAWRTYQSAQAAVLAANPGRVQLVAFDAVACSRWRNPQGLPDTEAVHLAWARTVASSLPP